MLGCDLIYLVLSKIKGLLNKLIVWSVVVTPKFLYMTVLRGYSLAGVEASWLSILKLDLHREHLFPLMMCSYVNNKSSTNFLKYHMYILHKIEKTLIVQSKDIYLFVYLLWL